MCGRVWEKKRDATDGMYLCCVRRRKTPTLKNRGWGTLRRSVKGRVKATVRRCEIPARQDVRPSAWACLSDAPTTTSKLFLVGFVEEVEGEFGGVAGAGDADGDYGAGAVFFEEGVG
jgi:hypothetical protein